MEMAGSKTTSLRLNATSAKGRMLSMWFRKSKQRMIWKLSADHFAGQAHEVLGLRAVAEHVGRADQDLLEGLRGELVPFLRLGEGVGHVRHHGDVEVRAAAVLKGEKAAVVQVGPHEAVFGEAERLPLLDWVLSRVVVSVKWTRPLSRT